MINEDDAVVLDFSSIGVIVATLAGWLPSISSVLAIIWISIRIYESPTVQGFIAGIRKRNVKLHATDVQNAADQESGATIRKEQEKKDAEG